MPPFAFLRVASWDVTGLPARLSRARQPPEKLDLQAEKADSAPAERFAATADRGFMVNQIPGMLLRKTFPNQISRLGDVDRAKLQLDATAGSAALFDLIREIALAVGENSKRKIAFQCACGALGLVARNHVERLRERIVDGKGAARCPRCAGYEISLRRGRPKTTIGQGLAAFDQLLEAARKNNRASLCGFMVSAQMPKAEQLAEVRRITAVVRDLIAKNKLDLLLSDQGIAPVRLSLDHARLADLTLHLLSYRQLYGLTALYDALLNLIAIGAGEARIFDPEQQSLKAVSRQIQAEDDQDREATINRKIEEIQRYCGEQGHGAIQALIGQVYRPDIYQAIASSRYEIAEAELRLTDSGLAVPLSEVVDISLGLHLLVERLVGFLEDEQKAFAESEGVVEGDFRISPVKDGETFAVRITNAAGDGRG